MNKPARVQRKRTKGWRMPENTIYVGRPTKYGNPLKLIGDTIYIDASYRRKVFDKWVISREYSDIDDLMHLFWLIARGTLCADPDLEHWAKIYRENNFLTELKGKNLACFCNLGKQCHADVLIELANEK